MEQEQTIPSRPASRKRRLALIGGALAAVGLIGVTGFSMRGGAPVAEASVAPSPQAEGDDKKKEKEPTLVAVETVREGTISAYITATANLVAENEVMVVAEAEGKVVGLNVEEGDRVARGARLVEIDRDDASLEVRKAELNLQNAALNLERAEKMAADRLISPQELDKSRFEHDLKQHELAEARHRLEKTTVVAPFAGRITVRKVQPGETVKLGDELFTLADFEPLVARIFLPEREVIDLRVGQQALLSLKAREDVRFAGRIQQISPVVDTASGTVKVTVEAIAPPAGVRPGAFVSVGIVRESREGALLIPREAVLRELQATYVYVAEGDVARKRPVELGLEEGTRLEVRTGLAAGDRVVTSGQGALKDGAPLKVQDTRS